MSGTNILTGRKVTLSAINLSKLNISNVYLIIALLLYDHRLRVKTGGRFCFTQRFWNVPSETETILPSVTTASNRRFAFGFKGSRVQGFKMPCGQFKGLRV